MNPKTTIANCNILFRFFFFFFRNMLVNCRPFAIVLPSVWKKVSEGGGAVISLFDLFGHNIRQINREIKWISNLTNYEIYNSVYCFRNLGDTNVLLHRGRMQLWHPIGLLRHPVDPANPFGGLANIRWFLEYATLSGSSGDPANLRSVLNLISVLFCSKWKMYKISSVSIYIMFKNLLKAQTKFCERDLIKLRSDYKKNYHSKLFFWNLLTYAIYEIYILANMFAVITLRLCISVCLPKKTQKCW